jgi:hypothetical protein
MDDDTKRFPAIAIDRSRWEVSATDSNLGDGEPHNDVVLLLFDREGTAPPGHDFNVMLAPAAARDFAREVLRLAEDLDRRRRRVAEGN